MRRKYKSDMSDRSDESDPYSIKIADAETAANTLLCLINQASYLLGRQIRTIEQTFLTEGGFTERMYQARKNMRRREDS